MCALPANICCGSVTGASWWAADMRGLEWSTGSSTQWLLMRVKSLISIEHHAEWSSMVDAHMNRVYGADYIAKRCATKQLTAWQTV